MSRGSPESILRARIVLIVPSARRATSSASTMPAYPASTTDDDGRFAASSRGVVEVSSGAQVGGTIAPNNDVIESKGEDHLFGYTVLVLLASRCPIRVRAEALVEIPAVVVDKIITSIDDLFGDKKGRTLSLRPIGFPRVEAIHALVIGGVNMGDLLFEGLNVHEGDKDNGAGDLRGIKSVDERFNRDDGGVFSTMGAGDKS